MASNKPVAYDLDHVDSDWHAPFPLVLSAKVTPAPTIKVTNVTRVNVRRKMTHVFQHPHYPRVLLPGDWT